MQEVILVKIFEIGGNIAAVAGAFICLFAGLVRITGHYYLSGFETNTLFIVGIALMVMACLVKLHALRGYIKESFINSMRP